MAGNFCPGLLTIGVDKKAMFSDIPLFSDLKTRLSWHQTRQNLLAENIAHADTPGYQGRDLKAPDFNGAMNEVAGQRIAMATTSAMHISAEMRTGPVQSGKKVAGWEVTPERNGVVLEEQMMKVAQNQMDFQAATTLYSRALSLFRVAAGSR